VPNEYPGSVGGAHPTSLGVGTTEHLIAIVEDDSPSAALLTGHAGVRYVFIEPNSPAPDDVFQSDALFTWDPSNPFLRDNWSRFTNLRWVHASSAGVDRLLFSELVNSDVVLTNSRYVFDEALAEYVIGLMLMMSKDLGATLAFQREHRWIQRESDTLHGKVVVLVGVGPIARRVARFATAFGMVVHRIGRTARGRDPDFGDITTPETMQMLFAIADYVVMVLPKNGGDGEAGRRSRVGGAPTVCASDQRRQSMVARPGGAGSSVARRPAGGGRAGCRHARAAFRRRPALGHAQPAHLTAHVRRLPRVENGHRQAL
jgi:hypothetical protein